MSSITRHHADWLSLLEISGPFLSLPVLMRAFPQGLEAHDPVTAGRLRLAFPEWEESGRSEPAIHHAWLRFVLTEVLEWPAAQLVEGPALPPQLSVPIAEHGETLRPDLALLDPGDGGKPRVLVQLLPPGTNLEKPLPGKRWSAGPATRMMELLHATEVRLGLVTNGERWLLVDAPRGETTGFASWYAPLWIEEPITLQAFRSLLGAHRLFGVGPNDTLEALLAASAGDQQEVTDQLGRQVRTAVEILIQAIDRIDKDRGRALLTGIDERGLYSAALTVMMRLVFLLCAEERGLLRLGDELYDQHYAVSTLRAQLRDTADRFGEEVLSYRQDAWSRLLATFRAVHGGVEHEAMRLPAYGGTLFDPDRFPFLEGRPATTAWRDTPAQPLPVNNRVVLHLLEALQVLQVRVAGGGAAEARLLSFRALDIEQIGHVYEGLLDHTAVRAAEPMLGLLGAAGKDTAVGLATLEAQAARGEAHLATWLKERTGRSEKALLKAVGAAGTTPLLDEQTLRAACDNDEALLTRVRPFAGFLRPDTNGYPVVIAAGSVYVAEGSDRRSTGTHYTPRSLTEPIVRYTLEPLVYAGPAEGWPKERWALRPAGELLALKVCDLAMGSGAFLVQACRYLAERLVESWGEAERRHAGRVVISPEGDLSSGDPDERPLPRDPDERLAIARRLVADRCLYGVDVNPMAVEMAKLSLWLVTLQKDRPFTFLDHALRGGDSLLGVAEVEQFTSWSLTPRDGHQNPAFRRVLEDALRHALRLRRRLTAIEDLSARDTEEKRRLLDQADAAVDVVKLGADLLAATGLAPRRNQEELRNTLLYRFQILLTVQEDRRGQAYKPHVYEQDRQALAELQAEADALLGNRRPFHWPLEFPEVFIDEATIGTPLGFDALVGNPPFMGGQKITGNLGTDYRDYLVEQIGGGKRGSADLCAYFFLRGRQLLRPSGGFGMLATNTIAQGDTREVGLDQLLAAGCVIPRAVPSRKWPGIANLEVAHVWVRGGSWNGDYSLDDATVSGVTAFLASPEVVQGTPYRLAANAGKSFHCSVVLGMGFVLSPDEAHSLIEKDPRNRDVLFPYLNGEDLNSRPDQSPSRWVIDFHDWPLERAETYPDCMVIVREKVKPERDLNNRKVRRERWWQFAERAPELYATIAGMDRVLSVAATSRTLAFAFVDTDMVFSHATYVFALDDDTDFASLQSVFHDAWAREYGSSMKKDLRYTPSDVFSTFAFPPITPAQCVAGRVVQEHRQSIMLSRGEGLTKICNRLNNPQDKSGDIHLLRDLQIEMDSAVAASYGWNDLEFNHGFHQTKHGMRFTISDTARREVLGRLLALNHQRYQDEVEQGLHDKGSARGKRATTKAPGQPKRSLFEQEAM